MRKRLSEIQIQLQSKFKDVLAWGQGLSNGKVQRAAAEIDGEKGTFYGEWQYGADKQLKPSGCGVLLSESSFKLGTVKEDKWQ